MVNSEKKSLSELHDNPQVCELLMELEIVLSKAPKDLNKFIKRLNAINKKAEQTLSEVDAIVIYAGTSTVYNSFIYWQENSTKWIIALNNPELLAEYTDDELNNLNLNNTNLGKPIPQTRGWWDSITEIWDDVSDSIEEWWDNSGRDIVISDGGSAIGGAAVGGASGAFVAGVGAAAGVGAITGGAGASISEAFEQCLK